MPLPENIKKIREFRGFKPPEVIVGAGVNKTSYYEWEAGKYGPDSENLDKLAKFFRVPKFVFSVEDLTEEYLKINFSEKNGTDMQKTGDNTGKSENEPVWEMIEKSDKYTVVPTIILDKYEILSNREIESRETTLQEVRATMKIAIAAKDDVIAVLRNEIDELRARLNAVPSTQKTQ